MYYWCYDFFFFFNDTATTEIYTYDTLFPYTTLFRSCITAIPHSRPFRCDQCGYGGRCLDALNGRIQPRLGYGCRSEEHTSELQSLMRISYAVFCLKKKTKNQLQQKQQPNLLHISIVGHTLQPSHMMYKYI